MLFVLILLPAVSQAEIFKCTKNGTLVFTDKPCAGETVTLGITNVMPAEKEPFDYVPLKRPYNSHDWYYGHSGYKRALKLQAKYDAPLFLYFQADWCGYCRTLEKKLINTYEGKMALKKAIKVKISPEDSKKDDDLFRKLGGSAYPTLYMQSNNAAQPKRVPTYRKQNGEKKMLSAADLRLLITLNP